MDNEIKHFDAFEKQFLSRDDDGRALVLTVAVISLGSGLLRAPQIA
jgi:hypothetical protein